MSLANNAEREFTTVAGMARAGTHLRSAVGEFTWPVPADWCGVYGGQLPDEVITVRIAGNIDGPPVLVLGGISADRCVADESDELCGWWGQIARPGGALDLDRFCVIGADYPPVHAVLETDLCPEDIANLLNSALKAAGIYRLHALVGASFGGMVALAFARLFPDAISKLVTVCAAHRPHPMAQAWRLVQRETIELARTAGLPKQGVALARKLAMTTYRTPEEFSERFDPRPGSTGGVGHYLQARGRDFADRTSAARYLTLSAAIDRHHELPERIIVPALIMGALSDRLVPLDDIAELHRRYAGPSQFAAFSSLYGHDAFLKETETIGYHLQSFLEESPA